MRWQDDARKDHPHDEREADNVPTSLPTRPMPEPADDAGAKPYGMVGLVVSLVAILVAAGVLTLLALAGGFVGYALAFGFHDAVDRFQNLDPSGGTDAVFREKLAVVVSLILYASLSTAIILAALWRGRRQWRDLVAWRPWDAMGGARLIGGLAIVTLVYSLAADAAIAYVYPKFQDMVHMPKGLPWIVLFVALASIAAPITEELLFRGWLYTSLRRAIGVRAGILLTAVLFALAHWEQTHLYALAVFPVGLALGYLRERTGSIKATMIFHGLYNGVASALLFFAQ